MAKGSLGDNWEHFNSLIGVKIQKKERPKIEIIMEHLITDPSLKNGLQQIVDVLKENNIKPTWFTTSHYKFKYNKEIILQVKFGDGFKFRENEVEVKVLISPVEMERFEEFLTDEMRNIATKMVENRTFMTCGGRSHCDNRKDFEYKGKQYKQVCTANLNMVILLLFSHTKNLDEQFQTIAEWIKTLIIFKMFNRTK